MIWQNFSFQWPPILAQVSAKWRQWGCSPGTIQVVGDSGVAGATARLLLTYDLSKDTLYGIDLLFAEVRLPGTGENKPMMRVVLGIWSGLTSW